MGIFETGKAAANVLKEAGKIDEYRTILELLDELLEKRNQIQNLNDEVSELKEKLKLKESLIMKKGAYYTKDTGDGPFCPSCYDLNINAIRIFQSDPQDIHAQCPVCKNNFNITGRSSSQEADAAIAEYNRQVASDGF